MKLRPFDFNIHLVPALTDVDGQISSEQTLDAKTALVCYESFRAEARRRLSGVNIMLLNQSWSHRPDEMQPLAEAAKEDFGNRAVFTQLVDFHRAPSSKKLATARKHGLRGIKFHSYVQKITESDWHEALKWAKAAVADNLYICIDASYGTTGMYQYDNLRFAAWLASRITTVPIIILHSGGLRAMEAWLLASSCPHVWLETSFSLPFYEGTRVEQDIASVYQKMGGERIVYASDHPYITMKDSLTIFKRVVSRYHFSSAMQNKMLLRNAELLLEAVM